MKPLIQRKGDVVKALLAGEIDYIMHCVNCQGVMGGGIAKQIKATFPNVFREYKTSCNVKDSSKLLGNVLVFQSVINIFAQNNFGVHERQLHYGALSKALSKVSTHSELINKFHIKYGPDFNEKLKIGVPKLMCCALAGGRWEVVSEMLEGLPDWIEVVVYDFN
jgi:hypothetical protein